MKKIIISEKSLKRNKIKLKEEIDNGLSSFIMDKVLKKQTSLSYCDLLQGNDSVILKERFNEIKDRLFSFNDIQTTDEEYLYSYLSHLIVRAQKLETPIENNLIKICENIIIKLFNIPSETVNFTCKLVKKITPKEGAIRLLPENEKPVNYDFSQLLKNENIKDLIIKRRFINSLIQGGAYELGTFFELYDIKNEELIEIYKRIIAINDFILFSYEEKISDKYPKQGAYVEVLLGREGEKTEINSQGIIFPLLLIETIRGFLELFGSHGLPKDNNLAREVIEHSDFLIAEPWDLRYGVSLWERLTQDIDNTQIIPYYFTNLCDLHNDDFKLVISKIVENDLEGRVLNNDLIDKAKKEFDYQKFMDTLQQKNSDVAVITDDITKPEDLDKIELQEDYRQLSIPFDGSYWKYNYEYFLDYLEKIGKKGTLPPDEWTKNNGFKVSDNIAWEYDFYPIMSKMTCSSEIAPFFIEFWQDYQDGDIIDEYNSLSEKQEIYHDIYNIIDQWDYTDETDKEEAINEIKKELKEYDESYLDYALKMLDEYIEYGNIDYPEISYELEVENEKQCEINNIIEDCEKGESIITLYNKTIKLLEDMGENPDYLADEIGTKIENNMQRLIDNYFQFDENGLLIIERGIRIKDLLQKPDELKNSTYHKTIENYNDGIGNCWSWCEGYGQPYSNEENGDAIIFKGKVNVNSVDWLSTMALYYEFDNEREIRLKPNSIIEVDEIILSSNGKHLPLNGSILVSSGNSYTSYF